MFKSYLHSVCLPAFPLPAFNTLMMKLQQQVCMGPSEFLPRNLNRQRVMAVSLHLLPSCGTSSTPGSSLEQPGSPPDSPRDDRTAQRSVTPRTPPPVGGVTNRPGPTRRHGRSRQGADMKSYEKKKLLLA